ncbi:hypothetical protein J6590_010634 [Homalodisca vitripennis]|nr:hypothetical protein J6590_010634 [Homalodisca vitripennis]
MHLFSSKIRRSSVGALAHTFTVSKQLIVSLTVLTHVTVSSSARRGVRWAAAREMIALCHSVSSRLPLALLARSLASVRVLLLYSVVPSHSLD